ncbi:hypothetical protein HY793_03485 [Candidatus Desantisbacteria bacterium]|nr:hypothetical protein [Candidatus Desantisbacteria bacterium]
MICPHCGYEKNTEDALCCNLCHVVFRKKDKQEIPATVDTISAKGVTSFDSLPDELKTILLKEKDEVFRDSGNPIIESKKMMLIGILFVFILLLVGGMFLIAPVIRTMLTKGQG